jgi:hypothetical protein
MCFAPVSPFFCFVWRLAPLAIGGLSDWVSQTICMNTEPSARRCRQSVMLESWSRARLLNWAYPPMPLNLVVFLSGPSEQSLLATCSTCEDHQWRCFCLAFIAISDRTKTFLLVGSIILKGNACVSTYIFKKNNRPSFMADCICRRKILQLLVAWEKGLCHLQ